MQMILMFEQLNFIYAGNKATRYVISNLETVSNFNENIKVAEILTTHLFILSLTAKRHTVQS